MNNGEAYRAYRFEREGRADYYDGEGRSLKKAFLKAPYGKLVIINHPNGWKTYYGHLSKIEKDVKKGARVEQGRIIGRVGSTGLATGPHLHYEVRIRNKPVNPLGLKLPRAARFLRRPGPSSQSSGTEWICGLPQ